MRRLRLTDGTTAARVTLAVDLLALALFVVAGMQSHRTDSQLDIFLRNAVPIGSAWLATALAFGTYRPVSLGRLVATWAVAVPLGVVVRSWWTGSPKGDDLLLFAAVAMVFTLAFLAGGRVVSSVVSPRVRSRGAP